MISSSDAAPAFLSHPSRFYSSAAWYVLRTKPRQEKRAQDNLKAWGLETLLPLLPERRKKLRPMDGIRALFPSYIFCRFRDELFDKVKFTHGIAYVVAFGGTPAVVDQCIIDGLRARMDAGGAVALLEDVDAAPGPGLRAGDQVMIKTGMFANMAGVLQKDITGSDRVRILLDTVKRTTVECPISEVRKLSQ